MEKRRHRLGTFEGHGSADSTEMDERFRYFEFPEQEEI